MRNCISKLQFFSSLKLVFLRNQRKDISCKVHETHRLCYQSSYQDLPSLTLLHNSVKMAAKNISKRPHVFFSKRSKGELLIHYKLSELALADINKVCILHVKRVIEPQRPLNTCTNYQCNHRLFFGYYENSENFHTR